MRDKGPPSLHKLAAGSWALFLDIDGTLFDLVDDPKSVKADADLLALLDRCTVRFNGALALISGRDLAAIDRIMSPRLYPAAGSHGAEIRHMRTETRLEAETSRLRSVADELDRLIADGDGSMIERKPYSLALHFRGRPERQGAVLAAARTALARLGGGYRILSGKDVYELLPVTVGKGAAIDRFMSIPPFAGRRPIFAGDDVTDEDGFDIVNRADGMSIRIGDAAGSKARFALPAPSDLRRWLDAGL